MLKTPGLVTNSQQFLLENVLHGRLQKSKIRRREGLKGLLSYIRPVGAGCSSCWP
jgi:hypothetical protein